MSYWANKKANKTKKCKLNAKMRNKDYDSSKENIFGLAKSMANIDDASAHYLYVDPKFVGSIPTKKLSKRLRGGEYESEIYYDCLSCHNDTKPPPPPAQHSRMDYISGDIEDAKEFKKALKQMALSSNALYRTFRQEYVKNQKPKRILNEISDERYCFKCGGQKSCENIGGETECNDNINPFNVVNVVLPTNNETACDKCELKEEKPLKGVISKSTNCSSKGTGQHSAAKLSPQEAPPCIMKSNITEHLDNPFKDLIFCEKCAILRGELPSYKNLKTDNRVNSKRNVIDNSCQTCCEPVVCCNNPIKIFQDDIPIYITLPLNVQIDAEGGRAHIIDSEILIETSADKNVQKHYVGPSIANAPIDQDHNVEQGDSNAFHSYTSSLAAGTGDNEISINISTPIGTVANDKDFYPCIPRFKGTEGNESSINVSTPIRTVANNDDFNPRLKGTESQQSSVQNPTSTRSEPKKEVEKEKEQTSKPLTDLELLKMKTELLRAELVQEIKTTLEHNTPPADMHELDLPANVRRKNEINDGLTGKFILPDGHQARNKEQEPLMPISPGIINSETQSNIAEGVQTNISAIEPSSRYKRNELRMQIQNQLKGLLQSHKFVLQEVYDTEERNAILLDFQKIFHPEVSDMLSKELRLAEAVQGIRYILEPEQPQNSADESLKLSESAVDILEDIRNILIMKPKRLDKSTHKKYHREAKETILEGLQTILKPRKEQTLQFSQEIRDIALHDLNVMLKTSQAKTLPMHEPKQELKQEPKKELDNQKFTEIREGLLADLRLMLDATSDAVNDHSGPSTSRSPGVQQRTAPRQINETLDGLLAEFRRMLNASPHLKASIDSLREIKQQRQ